MRDNHDPTGSTETPATPTPEQKNPHQVPLKTVLNMVEHYAGSTTWFGRLKGDWADHFETQYLIATRELRVENRVLREQRDRWREAFQKDRDLLDRLEPENDKLRRALSVSKDPCLYCSLPAEDQAKCPSGFPGCARADDQVGCPELGAKLELEEVQKKLTDKTEEVEVLWASMKAICRQAISTPATETGVLQYVRDRLAMIEKSGIVSMDDVRAILQLIAK